MQPGGGESPVGDIKFTSLLFVVDVVLLDSTGEDLQAEEAEVRPTGEH